MSLFFRLSFGSFELCLLLLPGFLNFDGLVEGSVRVVRLVDSQERSEVDVGAHERDKENEHLESGTALEDFLEDPESCASSGRIGVLRSGNVHSVWVSWEY